MFFSYGFGFHTYSGNFFNQGEDIVYHAITPYIGFGNIDNLLSSGMFEIAKQLSIKNYVYERNDKPSSTKNNKPKTDPNKVYHIADAGSIVLGDIDAKVSIIKWTDFQ